jgi:O-antigen/teichoic acid export membrane protein
VYTAKGEKIQPPAFVIGIISSIISMIAVFLIFSQIGISFYVLGYVIFTLATAEILGKKQYGNYSKYLISQKILMIVFALFFYYYIGLEGVILGISLSFLPYMIRIYKSLRKDKIDFSLIKPRIGFIMNSYALDLSRTFSGYTDKLIVAPLFGFAILGNYQLGIQVLSIIAILPGIVYLYILPRDSSGESNKKLKKLTIGVSIVLAILGIVLAPIILPILFPEFTEAVEVIQIISISVIPSTINLMYISKFLGKELSKVVLIGSGIFLAVQIISILVLGELFGVNGVALALTLGASSEAIFLVSVNKLIYKFDD